MAAHYDFYDYPAFWKERDYEHQAEVNVLKDLLQKIPKIHTVLDIGAGYGRLTPYYLFRGRKIILLDPSAKLLKLAKLKFNERKIHLIHSRLENALSKLRKNSVDTVILIRVLHHVEDVDLCFKIISRVLKKKGYFILEFANKRHLKATFLEFLKGNFTFPIDIFPKELVGKKKKRKILPIKNYHPDIIKEKLEKSGFEILESRSVSNIRNPLIKKIFPVYFLLFLEKYTQKIFSKADLGPSIFLLCQKQKG